MTKYEQQMYERDLPGIRKSLESIASTLKKMETIISDPGDEIEHIIEGEQVKRRLAHMHAKSAEKRNLPDDYKMD